MAKPPTDANHLGSTITLQMKACENITPNPDYGGESEKRLYIVFESAKFA